MKTWPALEGRAEPSDLLLAALDEFAPTAIEERRGGLRIFFDSSDRRDAALSALADKWPFVPIDVPDEDWACRSQRNSTPVSVGRLTVAPPWAGLVATISSPIVIVIAPSMGFGTGHHETTRLCLAALQTTDLAGASLLDVGTGSGVLALAGVALGARRALAIDRDADAVESAVRNLALNPGIEALRRVEFVVGDLHTVALQPADVVVANLTAGSLTRDAARLAAAVRPGGTLIVSGLERHERDEVRHAFGSFRVVRDDHEHGWVALTLASG